MKKTNKISIADVISSSRIIIALLIFILPVFSVPFYVFYCLGAVTDMVDGIVARTLHQESAFGTKIDTVSDMVFVIAVLIKIIAAVIVPVWLWIWTVIIALIKLTNILSGFVICHRFVAVHSTMNKLTGGILFTLPFIIALNLPQKIFSVICIITCVVATFAAVQEGHCIRAGKITA